MSKQLIIGIIVVVILVIGGGALIMSRGNSYQMNMPSQNTPGQTGTQAQTEANPTNAAPATAQNAVTIQNFAFSPATITVKAGDKVTWTNQDSVGHSATADDQSFDTGILDQGQSGSVTFSKAGTYTYHCSAHPNMKGTIIVQ